MSTQKTDLTFFTNDESQTLLDRFKATLADTRLLDVLVGYFHASGFYQLYNSIEPVEKTRILVGLGLDNEVYHAVNTSRRQTELDFKSHANAKKQFQEKLIQEVEHSPEPDEQLEVGLKKFIEFLRSDCPVAEADKEMGDNGKKLEIRAFPSRNIHTKVYICRRKKVILGPITNEMTDEEKLAVIQRQFDRIYDPRHLVRNHLETLDSVEVVRTIREALKR